MLSRPACPHQPQARAEPAAPGWVEERQALQAELAALRAAAGSGGDVLRLAQRQAESSAATANALAAELAALRASTAGAAAAPAPAEAEAASLRAALARLQGENASLAAAAQAAGAAADAAASALAAAKLQAASAAGSAVAQSTPPSSVVGCGPLDLADQMARLSSLLDGPAAAAAALVRPAPSALDRRVEALAHQYAELTKRAELDAAAAADVEAALVERCGAAEAELDALRAEIAERDAMLNWSRLC